MEDKQLLDGNYSKRLNSQDPTRKYLKHNLTSWMKYNKNKSKAIDVKLLEGKAAWEKLTSGAVKIIDDNKEEEQINSLQHAQAYIKKLRYQMEEYEMTNKTNLENAQIYIKAINEENDFLKKRLMEAYEKINMIEQIHGEEVFIPEILHATQELRNKQLKRKAFSLLRQKVRRQLSIKRSFTELEVKKEFYLKMRSFLGLQRHFMVEKYAQTAFRKRVLAAKYDVFKLIKDNYLIKHRKASFLEINEMIGKTVALKNLRFNCRSSKLQKQNKKLADSFHFFKLGQKTLSAHKSNVNKCNFFIKPFTFNQSLHLLSDQDLHRLRYVKKNIKTAVVF